MNTPEEYVELKPRRIQTRNYHYLKLCKCKHIFIATVLIQYILTEKYFRTKHVICYLPMETRISGFVTSFVLQVDQTGKLY